MKMSARFSTPLLFGVAFTWIGISLFGWCTLFRHTFRPSITAEIAARSLCAQGLAQPSEAFQIVIFAHPFCPCTQATLDKLDESLTRFPAKTSIRVIFVIEGLERSSVEESSSIAFARRLPKVEVQFDDTGEAVLHWGARVSGEVFAFNRSGHCVFHGGLTSGRGHKGDSLGQKELERRAAGGCDEQYAGPVFGCALPSRTLLTDRGQEL